MTWRQKHKENIKLITLFMASLEHEALTYDQRLKLITEIGRLRLQNQWIDQMTVEDYYLDCLIYPVKRESLLNPIDHEKGKHKSKV